ncbi:MAG: hypothetical protein ACLQU3_31040 [Limisphaerales bacterium]
MKGIGQKRRDKAGVWTCFGATQGHVLLRKGSEVRRLTEKEWDAMNFGDAFKTHVDEITGM